jgi:hypothetical protein
MSSETGPKEKNQLWEAAKKGIAIVVAIAALGFAFGL